MSILKIAKLGHPILNAKAKKVENILDLNIKYLINNMSETMLDAKGVGLAAPQIHISKQIIIFRIPESEDLDIKENASFLPCWLTRQSVPCDLTPASVTKDLDHGPCN